MCQLCERSAQVFAGLAVEYFELVDADGKTLRFNVSAARDILAEAPRDFVWADLPELWEHQLARLEVDMDHLTHVDTRIPAIAGTMPNPSGGPDLVYIIDGSHRLVRQHSEGHAKAPIFVLSAAETADILISDDELRLTRLLEEGRGVTVCVIAAS